MNSTRGAAPACLLPQDLGSELRILWEEFEAHTTPEARFAHAVDRFQPFLQNVKTRGGSWRLYGPTREQVLARMDPVRTVLPALWPLVLDYVEQFFARPTEPGPGPLHT